MSIVNFRVSSHRVTVSRPPWWQFWKQPVVHIDPVYREATFDFEGALDLTIDSETFAINGNVQITRAAGENSEGVGQWCLDHIDLSNVEVGETALKFHTEPDA